MTTTQKRLATPNDGRMPLNTLEGLCEDEL
jgi:hypothetical protein